MERGSGETVLSRWPVLTAAVVALIVMVASVAYVAEKDLGSSSSSTPALGPGISISVDTASIAMLSSMPLSTELANVTVQIFSDVPNSSGHTVVNLTNSNTSSNPYLDELFVGTPSPSGLVSGNLSSQFFTLDNAWRATMSPMTQTVSLQLYATLTVTQAGRVDQYTYFNNLPYSPRAPPAEFSASVYFPSNPTFSTPAPISTSVINDLLPAERPPPSCNPGYYWDPMNSTYISNGIVPLAIVNATSSPAGAEVSYQVSYSNTALQLSFTSATAWSNYTAYSGLQMSQAPSWSGDDTSFQGGVYGDGSNSGGTPSLIGLSGAELTITNYREWHVWGTWPNCHQAELDEGSTNVQLNGFGGGSNFQIVEANLPTYYGSLLSHMVDWTLLNTSTLVYGTGGIELYTVLETAAGYNNAQSAEGGAEAALSTLSFAIGAALLVCDVLDLIPGFGAPSTAVAAVSILADVTGMAAGSMNLFSTISFSTSETTSVEMFSVSVNTQGAHDNLQAAVYSASVAQQLTIGGTNYSPHMPVLYVDVT